MTPIPLGDQTNCTFKECSVGRSSHEKFITLKDRIYAGRLCRGVVPGNPSHASVHFIAHNL